MKLTAAKRKGKTKGETNKIRREGDIPAILYGNKIENQNVSVNGSEYRAILRSVKQGGLSTTMFELELDGKKLKAIVKHVQYHPTTYEILHLDFLLLDDHKEVNIKVPIRFTGKDACAGVKQGGVLRQVIRNVKVRCLPKKIPVEFFLDVKDIGMMGSKKLSELSLPEGVVPVANMSEVVAIVAKR